jgi:dolichyl-phosphate-mannose--protein O-mannosyl transferase
MRVIAEQRKISMQKSGYLNDIFSAMTFFSTGYMCHYLPFFAMERQLFLHHYLVSLVFGIFCLGAMFDLLTFRMGKSQWYFLFYCKGFRSAFKWSGVVLFCDIFSAWIWNSANKRPMLKIKVE